MRRVLLVTPLVILVGGCASALGRKPADRPDLVVPPPPAHVVPITPEPVIEPVADVPAPPNGSAPAGRGTGRGSRETPPKPAASEARPEAKPGETKPDTAIEAAPPAPPPPAPAPQLRTAESSGAEGAVRGAIERTRNLLNSIDYRLLNPARRKAYDDAKGFAQQAEDALKAGNMVFAQSVANKAEALAKELAGK
jgi:hypothetical protein